MKKEFADETMQSASSNGSGTAASVNTASSVTNKSKESTDSAQPNGELFLLYRYMRNRKIYHGVNAKNGATRKKSVLIPQEFSGELNFSCLLYPYLVGMPIGCLHTRNMSFAYYNFNIQLS